MKLCYYCVRETPPVRNVATVTIHDRRGCLHVCWTHVVWRSTTSNMIGHSPDCRYYESNESSPEGS